MRLVRGRHPGHPVVPLDLDESGHDIGLKAVGRHPRPRTVVAVPGHGAVHQSGVDSQKRLDVHTALAGVLRARAHDHDIGPPSKGIDGEWPSRRTRIQRNATGARIESMVHVRSGAERIADLTVAVSTTRVLDLHHVGAELN